VLLALVLGPAVSCSAPAVPEPEPSPVPTTAPAPLPSGTDGQPKVSATEHRGELVADLEVLPTASSKGKRVLFSQPVAVRTDDVLLAMAEFQVTNQIDKNVFVASQLVLSDHPNDVTGQPITPANGQNVTPDMHHGQQTKVGSVAADIEAAGVRYVNLVVWAAMTTAQPGDRIRIDQGYGRLTVMLW
jgi:hypothetical protein